jgi:TonB family protein
VPEVYISEHASIISAPNGDENYPPEAKRLGIEGFVRIKLGIDERGNVVYAKVVEKAGHGFDEAATKAMKQAKFNPARTSDGRAVPCSIIWTYRFESDR